MIVGSGVIAQCLDDRSDCVLYAAGVSNSKCEDADEFTRDRERLLSHLHRPGLLVYFSTCSDSDSDYVRHKRKLEQLVRDRGTYLICRLPIVAGKTTNPHTLLNYLHARIARSERFDLVPAARRNLIDTTDISTIVRWLLKQGAKNETVNVAAPMDYSMREIVKAFEDLLDKPAFVREHPGGGEPPIDVSRIVDAPINWDGAYLQNVLWHRYR
jgi:nucleoside-diphosphate-sugar epimerase